MKTNLPVTQREHVLPDGITLVSTTNAQGRITHCNAEFVKASGFDYAELLNQPHNLVRHPDMPEEVFADMWATIGRGRPWSGVVKNRRKNGDHYWVLANASPVMRDGKPAGYMSVRLKPTREQIQAAEALYARIAQERASGHRTFKLHAGQVRPLGWRDWAGRLHRLTLGQRLMLALAALVGVGTLPALWPDALGMGLPHWMTALVLQSAGAAAVLMWLGRTVLDELRRAEALARCVSNCNLDGNLAFTTTSPLGALMRGLWLINLNMRAVVTDVRAEVNGMVAQTQQIYQDSRELAARTESQAASVEETSASVEEVAGTIGQSMDTVNTVSSLSDSASGEAQRGAGAVARVAESMQSIHASSQRITAITEVMESLAFQTNLLALNAAVEAAHAGEQGRGFAVVAGEVRALAQRSTTAAHQIRELIGESAAEVGKGAQTVEQASITIRHAVESVGKVHQMLSLITEASREQSLGMGQINQAMHLIDDVTQQNAAQAESSARACNELERKADTLQRAVAIFQVAGNP
jgi:aerotaxis receptor